MNDGCNVIVSGSYDKTVGVWRFEGGRWLSGEPLVGHTQSVNSVSYCGSRQRIVSGASNATVRVWDKEGGAWTCSRSLTLEGSNNRQLVIKFGGVEGDWVSTALLSTDNNIYNFIKSLAMSGDGQRIVCQIRGFGIILLDQEGDTWKLDDDFSALATDVDSTRLMYKLAITLNGRRIAMLKCTTYDSRDALLSLSVSEQLSDGSWDCYEIEDDFHYILNGLPAAPALDFSPDGSTLRLNCKSNHESHNYFWRLVEGKWEYDDKHPPLHSDDTEHGRTMAHALFRMTVDCSCPNWEDVYAVHRGFCITTRNKPFVGFLIEKD